MILNHLDCVLYTVHRRHIKASYIDMYIPLVVDSDGSTDGVAIIILEDSVTDLIEVEDVACV